VLIRKGFYIERKPQEMLLGLPEKSQVVSKRSSAPDYFRSMSIRKTANMHR